MVRDGIFLSGKPGSNRPPRPWQGRALPNELLPRTCDEQSAAHQAFKFNSTKNFTGLQK